ncbi:MAG: hypothetical protein IJV82_04450 [Oscillospiraceae bacterium]|nr:hypothetical protein [Oscillospiraceae bacterium]
MAKVRISAIIFLIIELFLYYLILTAGGDVLVYSSFFSIVGCFLYALFWGKDRLFIAGLACTVGADFCLVVLSPVRRLWGMVFFLVAQSLYALRLHRNRPNRTLLIARGVLSVLAILVTFLVLKRNTDWLSIISIYYYVNLIMNIIVSFTQFRQNRLLPMGLVCFLLCDTVIGLQVAAGAYLPISEGNWLHDLIFMDFNLAWFFYLPSQITLALTATKHAKAFPLGGRCPEGADEGYAAGFSKHFR